MPIRKNHGGKTDNRRGRRFNVNWTTRVTLAGGAVMQTRVTDASATGFAFVSPLPFPMYENVCMTIEVGPTFSFQCVARIVREWGTADKRFYGVRLLRADEVDLKQYTDILLGNARQGKVITKALPGAWREF